MKKIKPGDQIKMYLRHGGALISTYRVEVIKVGRKYIYVDDGITIPVELRKFDMKTGKCLPDKPDYKGRYRTIDSLL